MPAPASVAFDRAENALVERPGVVTPDAEHLVRPNDRQVLVAQPDERFGSGKARPEDRLADVGVAQLVLRPDQTTLDRLVQDALSRQAAPVAANLDARVVAG